MTTPPDKFSLATWLFDNFADIYIWIVTLIGIPGIMLVDWHKKVGFRSRLGITFGLMLLGFFAAFSSFSVKERNVRKGLEESNRRLWVEKGGDSSPYILPSFDPDRTRLFIYNDSEFSAYILYRELNGTTFRIDGSSQTFKIPIEVPLEISEKDKRWVADLPDNPEMEKIRISFAGKARNGGFSNQIEIMKNQGNLACTWIAGRQTLRSKTVCP